MHYKIKCEMSEEFTRLVTERLLNLYERHKHDEKIFPKKEKDKQ